MFSCEFCEISKNIFFYRTHPAAAIVYFVPQAITSSKSSIETLEKVKKSGFILDTYCLHFLDKMPFFRNKMPYSLLITPKHMSFRDGLALSKKAICYYLYSLKNVKNTYGGVLILVQLQAEACNFTKINFPPWVFFMFFKLCKC